jgi:HAMP domain-containing protein
MRKRVLLTLALLAAVLLGGYLVLWVTAPRQRINAATTAQVRAGMTEREVEHLLGGPAGDYRTGAVTLDRGAGGAVPTLMDNGRFLDRHQWWHGDDGSLWVGFGGDGRLVNCAFIPGEREVPGALGFLLVVGIAVRLLMPRDPLEAAYHQIREGMTEREVDAIVGHSPSPLYLSGLSSARIVYWYEDRHTLVVRYDAAGCVVDKDLQEVEQPSLIERIRDWFGL